MGLKYLHYNTITLHCFEIDLFCLTLVVHEVLVFPEQ